MKRIIFAIAGLLLTASLGYCGDNMPRITQETAMSKTDEYEEKLAATIQALKDKDPNRRYFALFALQSIKDPKIIDPLIAMIRVEKEEELRRVACSLLGGMKNYLKPVPFIAILKDKNEIEQNRALAIEILGELKSREAVEPLIAILKNDKESEDTRKGTMLALMKINNLDDEQGLIQFLRNRNDPALNKLINEDQKQKIAQKQKIGPASLALFIQSDKQVYAEGEPIIITLTIENISKQKVSVFTRYLKLPSYMLQKGVCEIINSQKERIPCGWPLQATSAEKEEYIILKPNQAETFKFNLYSSPVKQLKSDTYTITYYYYGQDSYWDKDAPQRKKVEYPWTGTVVSNEICLQVLAKEKLIPAHQMQEDALEPNKEIEKTILESIENKLATPVCKHGYLETRRSQLAELGNFDKLPYLGDSNRATGESNRGRS